MEDMLEKADVALSKREAVIAEMRIKQRVTAEDMANLRVDTGFRKLASAFKSSLRVRQQRSFFAWKILATEAAGVDTLSDVKSEHSEVITGLRIEHSTSMEAAKARHNGAISLLESKHEQTRSELESKYNRDVEFSKEELAQARERFLASLTKSNLLAIISVMNKIMETRRSRSLHSALHRWVKRGRRREHSKQ